MNEEQRNTYRQYYPYVSWQYMCPRDLSNQRGYYPTAILSVIRDSDRALAFAVIMISHIEERWVDKVLIDTQISQSGL